MATDNISVNRLEDVRINVKIRLSALWVTLMLFYIYADILGFYTPGIIEKVMSGEVGGMQISEAVLVGMAVWMAVPSLMVYLSLVLKASVNRLINMLAGILSIFALSATFFAGDVSVRYALQAGIEAILVILIVWNAWKWPQSEA